MEVEAKPKCPRCGADAESGGIAGFCARCFSAGALDESAGWLSSTETDAATEAWPAVHGWCIISVLGAGGMGRVYLAENENSLTGALKVLDARWSHDPLMVARFEAEAAVLKALDHPNIVRVMDLAETEDGRLCLVMEHVDGCDLGRLLRGERLGHARAMDIFQKVCAAVSHAHQHGLAHRDIKPANVLVGRDGVVKLGDFGLAKRLGHMSSADSIGALTMTTDRFGTAYYLAPETLLHSHSDGVLADIYALGVLLYHLLTGQMPLGRFTPVSELTGLPKSMDTAISAALEADPAKRTTRVEILAQAADTAWKAYGRKNERSRNQKRLLIAAGALCFAGVAAGVGAWWQKEQNLKETAAPVFIPPTSATAEVPWENGLGMKFVPVPGTQVLFSLWETRRRDCEAFLRNIQQTTTNTWREYMRERSVSNIHTLDHGRLVEKGSWVEPGFEVTPDHPAGLITLWDARQFCLWLTWAELTQGRIKPGQHYRLPTRAEWLAACGGADAPLRPGNIAGPEARDEHWPVLWPTFTERDPFPRTAPVGSFPAERFGLFDISGNVCEWTMEDEYEESGARLLGPAFHDGSLDKARYEPKRQLPGKRRLQHIGFRIVLEIRPPDTQEGITGLSGKDSGE